LTSLSGVADRLILRECGSECAYFTTGDIPAVAVTKIAPTGRKWAVFFFPPQGLLLVRRMVSQSQHGRPKRASPSSSAALVYTLLGSNHRTR
jgi:hypothetical protein